MEQANEAVTRHEGFWHELRSGLMSARGQVRDQVAGLRRSVAALGQFVEKETAASAGAQAQVEERVREVRGCEGEVGELKRATAELRRMAELQERQRETVDRQGKMDLDKAEAALAQDLRRCSEAMQEASQGEKYREAEDQRRAAAAAAQKSAQKESDALDLQIAELEHQLRLVEGRNRTAELAAQRADSLREMVDREKCKLAELDVQVERLKEQLATVRGGTRTKEVTKEIPAGGVAVGSETNVEGSAGESLTPSQKPLTPTLGCLTGTLRDRTNVPLEKENDKLLDGKELFCSKSPGFYGKGELSLILETVEDELQDLGAKKTTPAKRKKSATRPARRKPKRA